MGILFLMSIAKVLSTDRKYYAAEEILTSQKVFSRAKKLIPSEFICIDNRRVLFKIVLSWSNKTHRVHVTLDDHDNDLRDCFPNYQRVLKLI